jgi:signal transduction histidine kinase
LTGLAFTSKSAEAEVSPEWMALLHEENHQATLRNIRTLAVIAMTLVPMCTVLDWYAYNHLWKDFLVTRLLASFVEVILICVSFTEFGKRNYRFLMLAVPMTPVVLISWMIHVTGDPASHYYAGLNLCLVGVGFLFQWSYVESLIAVLLTMACFLAATLTIFYDFNEQREVFGQFMNNTVFLLANSAIIVTGSVVHHRIRRNAALSRYRLADSRKELEQKNLQLVEMDRMKTDFFSNITHELRTPLTLMIAPIQRLQRLCAMPEGQQESSIRADLAAELGGIYHNGLRLLKLINDLLDLASADVGRMRLSRQRFSLKLFTGKLLQSLNTVAMQGEVTVKENLETPVDLVEADQEKLEKVLLNLLFNAVKFTPANGTVTLQSGLRGSDLVFEVMDTGVGISPKNLPFIFDRFWQADSSVTRQHPGTGIGLALVKELVEKMKGHVEAESELGKGTTIRVILPCLHKGDVLLLEGEEPQTQVTSNTSQTVEVATAEKQVAPESAPPDRSASAEWIQSIYKEAEQAQASKSQRNQAGMVELDSTERAELPLLLIVDDEAGMLDFMRRELEPHYRVMEAGDGLAALKAVEEFQPDMVIADYMMPNLDGLGLCRELRSRDLSRLMPIMLVTARSDEEVRLTALRNGANDVLIKPFSLTEFHTRIKNLVHSSRLQKEIELRNIELEQTLAELKSTEEDLIRSEKMASLGTLTGGILHEINNPLNFARSALYVLDRRAGSLPETIRGDFTEMVADLGEGIDRITTIVSDLRIFCHPRSDLGARCTVAEPLNAALRILQAPIQAAQVELTENIPEGLQLYGDKNQLTLVFLNLVKNAVDAHASEELVADKVRKIHVSAQSVGSEMEIRLQDNGPGIPEADLSRIFDPFYTTKAPGEGTGLGLSICYRIIAAHGGTIKAEPVPEGGVAFNVKLRRVPAVAPEPILLQPVLTA